MSSMFTESTVEEAFLEWGDGLAYSMVSGPEIAPKNRQPYRKQYNELDSVPR